MDTRTQEILDNMPTETGVQRATKRLAEKMVSNQEIPTQARAESRQVRRAKARRAEKDLAKHRNEEVMKRNKPQRTTFPFLNRAQYRMFISNRVPPKWRTQVLKQETERLASK